MTDLETHLIAWNKATGNLKWGVQQVLYDTLSAVKDEQVHLTYNADYNSDGQPCLINAAGNLLATGGGRGIPSAHFGALVSAFDRVNSELFKLEVNTSNGTVSPLAAEILLHHFAPLKERPLENKVNEAMAPEAFASGAYREPSDEDLTRSWLNAMSHELVDLPGHERTPDNHEWPV